MRKFKLFSKMNFFASNRFIGLCWNKLTQPVRYLPMLIFLGFLVIPEVDAQGRINFGRYQADSSIVVRKLGPQELNFNQRNGVILQESFGIIQIGIQDPELVVYEIEGPREMDILVRFEWSPLRRVLTSNNLSSTPATLPLNIRAAYSNRGATSLAQALGQVVELPSFTSNVVLPILRNSIHGPPGFPPSPLYHGNAQNRARMYFFIYGEIPPWQGRLSAGRYTGQVYISVGYPG